MGGIRLVPAEPDDLGYVEWLLREADLPHGDVRDGEATFYLALAGDDPVGVGGLDHRGDAVLLRSVVVEPEERGSGHGRALVRALLDRAAADAAEAYLLTTDAAEFFAGAGFEPVARDAAPAAIRGTAQFADQCPDSATCMRRTLDGP